MNIYRSTEDILLDMISSVQANGSRITDFNVGSVARTLFEAHAIALSEQSAIAEQLDRDSYLATAVGEALDRKAADHYVERKAAVAATGQVLISRAAPGESIFFPAGFTVLSTRPVAGRPAVQFVTTADATLQAAATSVAVAAQAVVGGADGNINDGTVLLPASPVLGIESDGGFTASGDFTGGVNEESDDALRERVRITVQGRVKGNEQAYLAAVLAIAGVESANVLKAGDVRADATTVDPGDVEVYYEGSAGLLSAVQSAVENAAVLNANATAFTADATTVIANVTVFVRPGEDEDEITAGVKTALKDAVNGVGVGGTVYISNAIQAVDAVEGVISATIPYADFRASDDAPGTAGNIALDGDHYPVLTDDNITVAVTEIS